MADYDMNLVLVWNTLMFFAHTDSYTKGERIGGVLAGCPRAAPPTADEMAGYAKHALAALRQHAGGKVEGWMLDGDPLPMQPWRVTAPDGRVWVNTRLLAAVSAAIEATQLQFPAASSADGPGVEASSPVVLETKDAPGADHG